MSSLIDACAERRGDLREPFPERRARRDARMKKLVPPESACARIPDGEFEDSVFVWMRREGRSVVEERAVAERGDDTFLPAPTLEEIMRELPAVRRGGWLTVRHGVIGYLRNGAWPLLMCEGDAPYENLAMAALMMWRRINLNKDKKHG